MSGPGGRPAAATAELQQLDDLLRTGQFAGALKLALQRLQTHPGFELHIRAAQAAIQLGQLALACGQLQHALVLRPDFQPARRQLSQLLNRLASASTPIDRVGLESALDWWPDNPVARFNLALQLHAEDPARCLQLLQPLAPSPPDAELEALRARAAALLGQAEVVNQTLPVLLGLGDPPPANLRELGQSLAWNSAPGSASSCLRKLAQARPSQLMAAVAAELALPATYTSVAELESARAGYAQGLERLQEHWTPARLRGCGAGLDELSWSNFLLAYQGQDDRALQCRYGDWLQQAVTALAPGVQPTGQRRPGRLRIGLLASFWRECTVGAYFGAWIGALRGPEHEVSLLSLGPNFDHWTTHLEAQADQSLRLGGRLADIASTVQALDLDLLIYPELGMEGRCLVLAALPLARRQWCGWGHPVTSGLPGIERFLSCALMEPETAAAHYRETLALLPDLGTRYALPPRPAALNRVDFGLSDHAPLLVMPSSAFKLHPDTDSGLAQLLDRHPDARLLLLRTETPGAMARLEQRLRGAGINPAQLHWLPALTRTQFLQLLGVCDLLLDPMHWSGGNTTLDALWMGLPVLARPGAFMRGRQSMAMLTALGVGEACGSSQGDADWVAAAGRLLEDVDLRLRWRAELPQRLQTWIADSTALVELNEQVGRALG